MMSGEEAPTMGWLQKGILDSLTVEFRTAKASSENIEVLEMVTGRYGHPAFNRCLVMPSAA